MGLWQLNWPFTVIQCILKEVVWKGGTYFLICGPKLPQNILARAILILGGKGALLHLRLNLLANGGASKHSEINVLSFIKYALMGHRV